MKIGPEKGRAPIPDDQAARVDTFADSQGQRLPEDYRNFLIRYDGGFPYPPYFDDVTPDELRRFPGRRTICDRLYGLQMVQDHAAGSIYGNANPPGFLFIGEDPGGLHLLLSLRATDHGAVFVWQATTNNWGTDGNDETRLFKQADSFSAFLDSLYDTPEKEGYDHWATPYVEANAVDVTLK